MDSIAMSSRTRRISVWNTSLWTLLVINCVLHATDANALIGSSRQGGDTIRSQVRQSVGQPLLTKWLANVSPEQKLAWLKNIEEEYYEKDEEEKVTSGAISFNSIKGYIGNNKTMVKLNVIGAGTFEVSTLILAYNDEGEVQLPLTTPWTGAAQDFDFEADIFGSETINLMLTGHIVDFNSSVTAEGMVKFEFRDPGFEMAYVGSDSKTSIRIAGNVPDSGIAGSVQCTIENGTACYELETEGSYCKMVDLGEDKTMTVCDSSTYIDELNEIPGEVDLMWMDMEMPMEMDRMNMDMQMLMATADFGEMPAKMEVLIYADDDPSKIYSPSDYFCEIQDMDKMDMDMDGTMCHQMLPAYIPSNQEGVQVLVVGLDANGHVIGSGLQHSVVNPDYTAIIVGSCMAAVVGTACIVAIIAYFIEKKKKKKLQDMELHSTSKPKY